MTEEPAADLAARLAGVGARHGFSPGAVAALWDAMRRGGGRMAQFSHPELGGMGQWSGGGMLQIGALFDHALKARVAAACADLAEVASARDGQGEGPGIDESPPRTGRDADPAASPPGQGGDWWPGGFGRPSASGSQDGLRYAYFAEARRLAVERDGAVTLYHTGRHRIFGVSQSRSRGPNLAFTADDGTVDLASLQVLAG